MGRRELVLEEFEVRQRVDVGIEVVRAPLDDWRILVRWPSVFRTFGTLSILFVGTISITLLAQTSTVTVVPDTEAEQHIGQDVTVEGVVTAVTTSRKGNTFINFGGAYPNQTFTGWIPARTPLATDASIPTLQGKKIKITGRIELYRGKPEIRVLSKSQIAEE